MISYTYTRNDTPLQVAANVISFIGLLKLRKHSGDLSQWLNGMKGAPERKNNLDRLWNKLQEFKGEAEVSLLRQLFSCSWFVWAEESQLGANAREIDTLVRSFFENFQSPEEKAVVEELAPYLDEEVEMSIFARIYLRHDLLFTSRASVFLVGIIPLISMSLGILCFVVALFCFIKDTQPHAVFYASVFVTLAVVVAYAVVGAGPGRIILGSELQTLRTEARYLSVKQMIRNSRLQRN